MNEHEPANTPDTERLVSELIDGTISDDDRAQLLAQLQADPAAREAYLELMDINSLLEWDYTEAGLPPSVGQPAESPGPAREPAAAVNPSARQVTLLRWSLAASVLLCVTLGGLLIQQLGMSQAVAETTHAEDGGPVAVITDLRKVIWANPAVAPQPYKSLTPGWLKLTAGRVALDLYGGSNLLLEGPAELGVNSADRVLIRSGKLSVLAGRHYVPVHVATSRLVATGRAAEFAVSVDLQGATELHVFSGSVQVEWLEGDLPAQEVAAGQALAVGSVDGKLQVEQVAADANQFAPVTDPSAATPTGKVFQVDFAKYAPKSYGYQDGQFDLPTHVEVQDGGSTLRLWGNAWKMVEVNVEITRDTVIEFEFRSPRQGQIHGLGFDNDDQYKSQEQPIFQFYGYEARQDIGQQFNDYSGTDWHKYRLRVGRYLTGHRRYLYFAADEDVTGECESLFRNVRIYEAAGQ